MWVLSGRLIAVADVVARVQESAAAADNLEVAVVSGRVAGSSNIANDLSLVDLLADIGCQLAAVRVAGSGAVRVADQDVVSIAVGPASVDDRARLGGPDGGACTCGDVGAGVVIVAPDRAGDVAAVDRPDVAAGVCVLVLPLRRHLFLQLLLELLDLLLDSALLNLQILHGCLILCGVVINFPNELIGLVPLTAKLPLLAL